MTAENQSCRPVRRDGGCRLRAGTAGLAAGRRERAEHAVRSDDAEHDACSAAAGADRADAGRSGAVGQGSCRSRAGHVPDVASSALKEFEDDTKMVAPLNASVDKVEEMDIYDANGKKIAEVDSVLEDANGEIKGVAIEYGGFLGFGEKGAILTLDQVKTQDGKLVTELTEEQLPTLPAWNQ